MGILAKKELVARESVQKLEKEIEMKDEIIDASKIDVENLKLNILEVQKQLEGGEDHETIKRELIMERDSAISEIQSLKSKITLLENENLKIESLDREIETLKTESSL